MHIFQKVSKENMRIDNGLSLTKIEDGTFIVILMVSETVSQ